MTFKNNKKVHLNEDTAIPASEIPVRRYVRCNSLLYPTDIQICNFNLQFTIVRESSSSYSSSSILITPTEVNNNGLLTVVESKLSTLNVQLVNTFDKTRTADVDYTFNNKMHESNTVMQLCICMDDGDHIII